MKSLLGFAIALVSLVLVLTVVEWDTREFTSPGPLHGAHRQLAELSGIGGCEKCHSGPGRTLATACTQCHEVIAEQLEHGRGLHGALAADGVETCGRCHVEHVGDDVPLTGDHSFANAGIPDRSAYDHAHVPGYDLDGRHAELRCEACHEHANTTFLEPGMRRFLGLHSSCTSCHHDPHASDFGTDCASCHGQSQPFDLVAEFEHDSRFALTGGHAGVGCRACHSPGTLRLTPGTPPPVRECVDCHADPHDPSTGTPTALRLSNTRDCATCHDATEFDAPSFSAADHARVAFALEGPHATTGCATCHGSGTTESVWARRGQPAPDATACAACHDSPHDTAFVDAVTSLRGEGCVTCHAPQDPSFDRMHAAMDPDLHTASGFSLAAPHAAVACAACHGDARTMPFEERFPGRSPSDCAACHDDPHGGQFDNAACVSCHAMSHFAPPVFDLAEHAATAFPLIGSHTAVACRACHREHDGGPRTFRGTATACDACHDDPHAGAFDEPGMPRSVDGRNGCARCHDTTTFLAVDWDAADHHTWTRFELRGPHAATSCANCHGRPFRYAPTRCADCHDDVHMGQFHENGATDCARCHDAAAASFTELTFDHGRDTNFDLDENHARLACSACHVEQPTKHGGSVVRYRPLGNSCRDCHATGETR